MKCTACDSDNLFGVITLTRMLPMAMRGGSVKVGGHKISQADLKDEWENSRGNPREIRGPIICADCATEMHYVVGASPALQEGSTEEARAELE